MFVLDDGWDVAYGVHPATQREQFGSLEVAEDRFPSCTGNPAERLKSLNDLVTTITGIKVHERIPDEVFDRADQVELVDIEPSDLLEQFKRGRYIENGRPSGPWKILHDSKLDGPKGNCPAPVCGSGKFADRQRADELPPCG